MNTQHSASDPDFTDRYRALFENSADAILIIEDDRFVDCNQAAVDMLGYTDKKSLLQCHPSELSPEHQPDGERSVDKANKILSDIVKSRSKLFEWDHLKASGEILSVEVSMTAVPTGRGHSLHVIWRDISERKRLAKHLRHSQKMEALGNLAGGIAHDFNNTLVPIVIYSDLLSLSLQDQPQLLEWTQEISRAGTLASSMVKKLLAASRQDERTPVLLDLEESVVNAIGLLRKLIGEDVEVALKCSGQPLWVETDPGDIEQILLNLASNSRDALPSGGVINITLSKSHQDDRHHACIEFRDNGIGMDPETMSQVFTPFFTTKELGSGTGLGMSSVFELVTKANGQIDVRSSLGEGTTFEVLFPIVEHQDCAVGRSEPAAQDMNTAQRDSSARILVVDDDARITQLVCHLLGNFGYRVCSAKNGCDALAILEETSHADLIIADVIMPRMGGPQLVREMHAKGIHIPVIFLSGYTDDRLTTYGFDMDGVSLIPKPFSADRLLHQVKQVLAANP